MAESQGKGLKTPVNGLFHENFEFEPLLGYDNFQNEIDTWETTVQSELVTRPDLLQPLHPGLPDDM